MEAEANIRELVCLHLGLEHLRSASGAKATPLSDWPREQRFDLVILDLMLPGLDGVTVCRAIRKDSKNTDVPILMLTARREESDKVVGLDSGADDYLTKPFGVRELMARVRALLRRGAGKPPGAADAGRPSSTSTSRWIPPAGGPRRRPDVELTTNEFQLLYVLLSNAGIVFSREALLNKVWKDEAFVTPGSVDTLVKRLRKKIEANPASRR